MKSLETKITKADILIDDCITNDRSFCVIGGAGAGKTASLIRALENVKKQKGAILRQNGQKVVCLTFTKRAVEVIKNRLSGDELFFVSTLNSFLWGEICQFPKDIRNELFNKIIPLYIEDQLKIDEGKSTKKATEAKEKAEKLEVQRQSLLNVSKFKYDDNVYSNYSKGELGHDEVINVAASLIQSRPLLRRLIGQKYPYILVDEAQDTQEEIVSSLNSICSNPGLPIIGYFGDPMQQIYDKRAGSFKGPEGSQIIYKEENFRCSAEVVKLLNAFRDDFQQIPAGENENVIGSVKIKCITAERPDLPRNRYSDNQIKRVSTLLDNTVDDWGWSGDTDVKQLYLVRQMIARKLGFISLHEIFDGKYASQRTKNDFETGEYFLLKPFLSCLYPLISAFKLNQIRTIIDILRLQAPAFSPSGINSRKSLSEMIKFASQCASELKVIWDSGTVGEVLQFAVSNGLIKATDRIDKQLSRKPRIEEYNEEDYGLEKQDWLIDEFFKSSLHGLENYCEFFNKNTIYSTQHGVKGEEYKKVLFVIDDLSSNWTNYNFSALLAPKTYSNNSRNASTDRQIRLSKNLAYVCFSRALIDLRIIFFTLDAPSAAQELVEKGLFNESQIEVLD